jgi:sigma-B regulation protein RsbU (phosphoserine phosphatase)
LPCGRTRRMRDQFLEENIASTVQKHPSPYQDLLESEETIRALLESASEGIVLVGSGGRIRLVNARIEQMFGYERHELLGRPIEVLIPIGSRQSHEEYCANYFRQPRVRAMGGARDLLARRKDGSEFPVDASLSYVQQGDEVLVLSFVSDITERRHAEETLKLYSERLEEMVEERTAELRQAQVQLLSQQRLQQELKLAEEVQTSMLPSEVPTLDGYEFGAMALSARYVSGDLYDFISCRPEVYHIVLADIAGKGVPAALLTFTARAFLRAETEHEGSPATIVTNVNASLYEDLTRAEMFITVLLARLDARLGMLTYASAGHAEALCWQTASRACRRLSATGLPLGILSDTSISEETLHLRPGDVLVVYSDGITEAVNADDELFGMERLDAILGRHVHLSAAELAKTITDAVESFRGDVPRSDDLTLVVLKVLPRSVSFAYPATLDHLNEVTTLVHQLGLAYGTDFAYQLELATSEIVTNVIRHAYRSSSGGVRGEIVLLPDRIQMDLFDTGDLFDPLQVPEHELGEPREGGYGLAIVRQLTDELVYTPCTPEGNRWRMVKLAGPSGATDPG